MHTIFVFTTFSFCTLLVIVFLFALLTLSWFHGKVPAIQHRITNVVFHLFFLLKLDKKFLKWGRSLTKPETEQQFTSQQVLEIVEMKTRSRVSFYFFAPFVYPFLALDLASNKNKGWDKIYKNFNHLLNGKRMVQRSEDVSRFYASELFSKYTDKSTWPVSDQLFRKCVLMTMWELLFDEKPNEEAIREIGEITADIARCFTYNEDPDYYQRITLLKSIQAKLPKVDLLHSKWTIQEYLTLIIMEFFVTPGLEITELLVNMIREIHINPSFSYHSGLNFRKWSVDALFAVACKYPVLQMINRETEYRSLISILYDQKKTWKEMFTPEQFLEDNNCHQYKWAAFGSGERICKGKQLALKMIPAILEEIQEKNGCWPEVQIQSGRLCNPFQTDPVGRMYLFEQRWFGSVLLANIDKYLVGKKKGERFMVPDWYFHCCG